MRRFAVGLTALALVVPLGLVHATAQSTPTLRAGAARADITPPKPGGAHDPANCTRVGGVGPFDGKVQFGLEERYADLNGNGVYDAPNPTTQTPGEPFLDCPTPTATGGIRPPDGRWDGIYLGGGDCCDRLADGTVFDRLEADALVISDGSRRIAVVTVDNEGVFKEIWDEVRAKVAADGVHLDAIVPSSTHDESAPDTIGITGPFEATSGVNPFYVEFFVARVASAIEHASTHLQPVRVRYGSTHADNLLPCWSSYPFVANENVGAMQVVAQGEGHVVATLVNFGIHAEDLGFDPKTRKKVSADWWHFLRRSIRTTYGDAPVLSMAGAVGSVEMPLILAGAFSRTPTGVHDFSSRDGCHTIYSGPHEVVTHEGGYASYTRRLGLTVAHWARVALRTGAWSRSTRVAFALKTIRLPVTNLLFLAAAPACVFDYRVFYVAGVTTGTGTPPLCGAGNEIVTDVGWFRIGDGSFAMAPGELFPSTYLHDFHGRSALANPSAGPVHGWVMARLGGRWRFVDGLANDLSGYIFPLDNEVGTPTRSNPNGNNHDRFTCHHVDDAEASSGEEGDLVDDAMLSLLPNRAGDQVRVGRYVYTDHSAHRDPVGVGILACDTAHARFRPAPEGGAVAVSVAPRGATSYDRKVARTYRVGAEGVSWMDLTGRRQVVPSEQTRGIVLRDGTRIWLDVYPA